MTASWHKSCHIQRLRDKTILQTESGSLSFVRHGNLWR